MQQGGLIPLTSRLYWRSQLNAVSLGPKCLSFTYFSLYFWGTRLPKIHVTSGPHHTKFHSYTTASLIRDRPGSCHTLFNGSQNEDKQLLQCSQFHRQGVLACKCQCMTVIMAVYSESSWAFQKTVLPMKLKRALEQWQSMGRQKRL